MKLKSLILLMTLIFSLKIYSAPVDLELSLVIDISGSVDSTEYSLQMNGYAEAFRSDAVQNAILNTGVNGSIAVNTILFATNPIESLPFVLLDSLDSINLFSDSLANLVRPDFDTNVNGPFDDGLLRQHTNIAGGIDLAVTTFGDETGSIANGFESNRQVIDVSIDGQQSSRSRGFTGERLPLLTNVRDDAINAGVDTINAVTIGSQVTTTYADNNLVAGANGFSIQAISFDDFRSAIQTKLVAEITGITPFGVPEPSPIFLLFISLLALLLSRFKLQ